MLEADARQQGGDPTRLDHPFLFRAVIQNGEVVSLHREGPYPRELCEDGRTRTRAILYRDGRPKDGTYLFTIFRSGQEPCTVSFQAPGGEVEEYYPHVASNFEMSVARLDISYLDKGLKRSASTDIVGICWGLTQMLRWHSERPDKSRPLPESVEELQVVPMGLHAAMEITNIWRPDPEGPISFIFEEHIFLMHKGVFYIVYIGIYQPWSTLLAQDMVNRVRKMWARNYNQDKQAEVNYRNNDAWCVAVHSPLSRRELYMAHQQALQDAWAHQQEEALRREQRFGLQADVMNLLDIGLFLSF